MTKLIEAIRNNDSLSVETLIKEGVDINEPMGGWYPLHYAAGLNNIYILKLLMRAGANIEAQDSSGNTALHLAARWGNLDVCKLLLTAGADMQAQDLSGDTALHLAAARGHLKVCKILIKAGANVNALNYEGKTPLAVAKAIETYCPEVIELLKQHGAKE